ncbi:MAG TPA: uroporphyrinogen-III synthase, partial [Pseudomonadales bacterium]|nr:uroporphyrinogen-III synthase [Pseudomonadales bacterium]
MGETSLEDLRVIVTRPQFQAQELAQSLTVLGAEVLQIPGLDIWPAPESWAVRQQFQNLDAYQHVIFTSVNAVHFGMQWIDRYWPQWPQGLNCYSVGPGTAKALTAHHIVSFLPTRFSSEGLLELPALMSVSEARVLIVKGQGGRSL